MNSLTIKSIRPHLASNRPFWAAFLQTALIRAVWVLALWALTWGGCAPPAQEEAADAPSVSAAEPAPADSSGQEKPEESSTLVVAARLKMGPIESFIEASSDVASLDQVEVYPQLGGIRIVEVLRDEGDFVKRGETLAKLDEAEIALELAQANVNHEEAKQRFEKAKITILEAEERAKTAGIQTEKARSDLDKSLSMFDNELIAEDELAADRLTWEEAASQLALARLQSDHARLDLDLSKNAVDKQRIAVDTASLKLSRTEIKAPFDGYIIYRSAVPGMTISASSHLFTLMNVEKLVADLYVPQEEILQVQKGMPVRFRCDALPGLELAGILDVVNPAVDPASGTVKLRARIAGSDPCPLRPGMFITGRIITASRERVLLIPRKAVFYDDEQPTFFLIRDDDRTVKKIHFQPAASTDTELEIGPFDPSSEPVQDGARVVIVGQDNLKDGDRVEVVKEIG